MMSVVAAVSAILAGQSTDVPLLLVNQAIHARGEFQPRGAERVAIRVRGTSTDHVNGVPRGPLPVVMVDAGDGRYWSEFTWPDERNGVKRFGSDGTRYWTSWNGAVVPTPPSEQAARRDNSYLTEVGRLKSLSDAKRFTLETIPDAVVGADKCKGVRVRSAGWPAVDLFFDPETHLLRKRVYDKLNVTGTRKKQVVVFSRHKRYGGAYFPTYTRTEPEDGSWFTDLTAESVEFVPVKEVGHLFRQP